MSATASKTCASSTESGALMTIPEFCRRNGMTTPTYYKYRKLDLTPTEIRLGALVLISPDAEVAWRERLSAPTGADKVAVDLSAERLRLRSQRALRAKSGG